MCGPAKTYCSTLCHIVDGKWVAVEGNPKARNDGGHAGVSGRALCAKGNAAIQTVNDPSRLRFPLKRVAPKAEAVAGGQDGFERCTWDEALSDIAARLARLKRDHGAECFGILSPQSFPVLGTLGRRFLNVYGSPNYLHSGICALQRQASKNVTIGAASCAPAQLDKTKLLVNWGANPENSGVAKSGIAARLNAQEAGLRVIDIRPMADALTARADVWLPVHPGTDGALALAILHVVIGEGLYDRDFVRDWCLGFEDLARHVEQFTPAWAAQKTGLAEDAIVRVARLMGTVRPMGIVYGNGIGDQQVDGHWTCASICLIEAITGNLDIPGGGGAPGPAFAPLVRPRKIDLLSERLPCSAEDERLGYAAGMSRLIAPEFPRWYQDPATWESGPNSAYFKALMTALTDEPIRLRAALAQSTNPLSATRQPKKVAEALRRLDLYVVHDTHWNPSCAFADYVLPACTQYECSQQFAVKNFPEGTFVAINQKIAEPPGEACSDWDFYLRLAVAMGYGADFWGGSMDACLREQLEGSGVTLEQLRAGARGHLRRASGGGAAPRGPFSPLPRVVRGASAGQGAVRERAFGGQADGGRDGGSGGAARIRRPARGDCGNPRVAGRVSAGVLGRACLPLVQPWLFFERALPTRTPAAPVGSDASRNGGGPRCGRRRLGARRVAARLGETGGRNDADHSPRRAYGAAGLVGRRAPNWGFPVTAALDGGSECAVLYASDPARSDAFHSAMAKQTLVRMGVLGKGGGVGAERVASKAPAGAVGAPTAASAGAGVATVEGRASAADAGAPAGVGAATAETAAPTGAGAAVPVALSRELRRGYSFDAARCIGCGACVVACKQWNGIPAGSPARCRLAETTCAVRQAADVTPSDGRRRPSGGGRRPSGSRRRPPVGFRPCGVTRAACGFGACCRRFGPGRACRSPVLGERVFALPSRALRGNMPHAGPVARCGLRGSGEKVAAPCATHA